jgi:hypothetical protein
MGGNRTSASRAIVFMARTIPSEAREVNEIVPREKKTFDSRFELTRYK